jgi:hypothetical protein
VEEAKQRTESMQNLKSMSNFKFGKSGEHEAKEVQYESPRPSMKTHRAGADSKNVENLDFSYPSRIGP